MSVSSAVKSLLPHCPWLMVLVIVRMCRVALTAGIWLYAAINSSARYILVVYYECTHHDSLGTSC